MEKSALEEMIIKKGFSKGKLARLCGMNYSVFCSRLSGESEFTLGEIQAIIKYLSLEKDEVMLIFFDA